MPAIGDVLDGRYKLERLLGQGGMGAVYVALEEQLGRRVAVKVLLPAAAANQEAVLRFEREARAAASLESEHVTRIFGTGRLPDGAPYMVMELLDGHDLSAVLKDNGPLAVPDVVGAIMAAAEALAEAHGRGIVHRDLKPANLFYARRMNGTRIVKVLDFGISKTATTSALGGGSGHLTATSAMMGTPYYMAPEQIREARDVDHRADLWALGITMFELLTGRLPFVAENLADLCISVLTKPHPRLRELRPDVPPELEAVIDHCLVKEREGRMSSVGELVGALAPFAPPPQTTPLGLGVSKGFAAAAGVPSGHARFAATPPPAGAATPPPGLRPALAGGGQTVDPVSHTAGLPKKSGAGLMVGAALVGLLVLGGGLAVGIRVLYKDSPAPAAAPPAPVASTAAPAPTPEAPSTGIAPLAKDPPPAPTAVRPTGKRDKPSGATATPLPSATTAPAKSVAPAHDKPSKPAIVPGGPLTIPDDRH